MLTRTILLALALPLLTLAGSRTDLLAQTSPGRPVDGPWMILEGSHGGSRYDGDVVIADAGAGKNLRWESDGTIYHGIGLYLDTMLYVAWGKGESYGLVLYTVRPNGTLDGIWTYAGNDETMGTEHAVGGSLEERSTVYTVNGVNPGAGGEYSGTLAVTRTGGTYQLRWEVGEVSYNGVGIRAGNRLVVGWGGSTPDYAVAAYVVESDRLVGARALPGDREPGREVLGRTVVATPGK